MENLKKCPNCGKEIIAEAETCNYCGKVLARENSPKDSLFKLCFWEQDYLSFKGKADRKTYWYSILFSCLLLLVAALIYILPIGDFKLLGQLEVFFVFLALIPYFVSLSVRRLRDLGKSGWWLLICLIPVVGWVWYFILMAKKGEVALSN